MRVCRLKLKPRTVQFNNKEYANISYAMSLVRARKELSELVGECEEVTLYNLLKELNLQIRSEESLDKIISIKEVRI